MEFSDINSLISYIRNNDLDAVVVEGYDGVGKGRVLNELSKALGVIPYRPDYNLWQDHDLRVSDRWKISGFFWDIFSHFNIHPQTPLLFDRGIFSGAVYQDDMSIVRDCSRLYRNSKILHVLVTCSGRDFIDFQKARNPSVSYEECEIEYQEYLERTFAYEQCFEKAGVDYVEFQNIYDRENSGAEFCIGCGHYSYGVCSHPTINHQVDPYNHRCILSEDKEVQDIVKSM